MTAIKKKTPAATGVIKTETSKKRNESVKHTLPATTDTFETTMTVSTGNAVIWVEADRHQVRLTDDFDSQITLTAQEALSVAAALEAVAVHLLEQEEQVA